MKRKEVSKRLGSLVLSGVLLISGTVPAMAEPVPAADENASAYIQDAEDPTQLPVEAVVPEIQEETPASDDEEQTEEAEVIEETEEIRESEDITETPAAAAMSLAEDSSQTPDLDIRFKDNKENTVTVLAKNISKEEAATAKSISIAVWSEKGDQDDLKWYEMSYSAADDAYKAEIPVAQHKTLGLYHVHLYLRDAKNTMHCLDMDTFEIHGVSADKLEVTSINKDAGTALVTLSGVTCPSDVTRVQFPIWCKEDQSDLVWYEGTKVSDGVYQVKLDITKHSYHYGTYKIHTYGTSGIGDRNFITSTTCTMEKGEISLTADVSSNGYTIKAFNLPMDGVKEVVFPIWSEKNDQDDLKWYTVKPSASGAATLAWDPSETGNYIIHCYTKTNDGKMTFQKALEVNVAGPSIDSMTITTDNSKGSFKITVKGLTSPTAIGKVEIPVWTDANQKDLVWYQAVKQADGSYTVSSDISKHGYRTGTYNAHLYVNDPNGKKTFLAKDTFLIKGTVGSLTAELSADQSKCQLSAKGIESPQALDHVEFAVWSDEGGQDDLKWYSAPVTSGSASYSVPVSNHKTAGIYQVHLYGVTKSGAKQFLDKTTFEVKADVNTQVSITDIDEKAATFHVNIKVDGSAQVSSMSVPVWCDPNQKDLVWYDAVKQADGTWTVKVDASKHNFNSGTYQIHVYAKLASGIQVKTAETSCDLNLKNYLGVINKGSGHRQVILKNPSAAYKKVEFPTWSDANGQDDLVWYQAVKQADGSWVADIYSSKHNSPGSYTIHCYGDSAFLGAVTTNFAQNEMKSIGDQKVEQYVNQILAVTGRDLYKVYLWCVNNINYEHLPIPMPYPEGTTRQQYYLIYAFEHRTGNCFNYAATFYYCAKALGYDARLIEGRYRRNDGTHGEHGWVEIWQNGVAYVCDPEIAWQSMLYQTYMRPYGSTTLTYFRNEAAY